MNVQIVPTILTKDPGEVLRRIKALEGKVARFQFDLIDGVFLPEKSVGLEALEGAKTSLEIDLHLMVDRPEEWVEKASRVAHLVIGQIEKMGSQQEFVKRVRDKGREVGLALAPETEIEMVQDLSVVDLVLVMTREPGFGKHVFNPEMLEKVKKLRQLTRETLDICVDGGIDEKNIQDCISAGANLIAIGGPLWQDNDLAKKLEEFQNILEIYSK